MKPIFIKPIFIKPYLLISSKAFKKCVANRHNKTT